MDIPCVSSVNATAYPVWLYPFMLYPLALCFFVLFLVGLNLALCVGVLLTWFTDYRISFFLRPPAGMYLATWTLKTRRLWVCRFPLQLGFSKVGQDYPFLGSLSIGFDNPVSRWPCSAVAWYSYLKPVQ